MKQRSSAIFQAQPSFWESIWHHQHFCSQAALFLMAIDLDLSLRQVNVRRAASVLRCTLIFCHLSHICIWPQTLVAYVQPKIVPICAHFANEINSGFIKCLVKRMLTTQEGVTLPTG